MRIWILHCRDLFINAVALAFLIGLDFPAPSLWFEEEQNCRVVDHFFFWHYYFLIDLLICYFPVALSDSDSPHVWQINLKITVQETTWSRNNTSCLVHDSIFPHKAQNSSECFDHIFLKWYHKSNSWLLMNVSWRCGLIFVKYSQSRIN